MGRVQADQMRLANVLVVDDRKADIELTRVFLQLRDKLHFNLREAGGGREGLTTLQTAKQRDEAIDLVLLDISMPGMDGFEMLQAMRNDDTLQDIAVVMCTGSTYEGDLARARVLGAAGYMVKPASLEQLRPVIRELPGLELAARDEATHLVCMA